MLTLFFVLVCIIVWYMLGLIGAMWLDPDELEDEGAYIMLSIVALFGPLAFLIGLGVKFFTFHRKQNENKTLRR